MKYFLISVISVTALIFAIYFFKDVYRRRGQFSRAPWLHLIGIGFVTNFFDTLGIGSFAPTTAFFKFTKYVEDKLIPGTLNVGHSLPTITEALIFITVVEVAPLTLVSMMAASTLGAVIGAGIVSKWPVKKIRLGLGGALLIVALAMLMGLLNLYPTGGDALALTGVKLIIAVAVSFVLGSLMTIGIGIYAPCMALVYALGMNPRAAFPIMMGSAALLMPMAGLRFIRASAYDPKASFGLTSLGIIAVIIAGLIVKSLPLTVLKWVVVAVILYTSGMMFRSVFKREKAAAPAEAETDTV